MSDAVLLLAHGTPEALDEIPEYLRNVTSGRPLPQHVIDEITHRYGLIGKSPLTDITNRQAELLHERIGLPVYVGMRNWKPYVADTVRRMRADGVSKAVAICLAPQNSRTSVGLYKRAAYAEAGDAIALDFVDAWAEHPLLIRAFTERLRPTWRQALQSGARPAVLFTAHSVPCRTIWSATSIPPAAQDPVAEASPANGRPAAAPVSPPKPQEPDPYAQEAKRTAARVAKAMADDGLRESDWFFAFQSQGASGGPWIGPSVEDTLLAMQQQGITRVVIHPIGFLCDHVEILYDIDIGFRDFGNQHGIEVIRPGSLNESPLLTDALLDLAQGGLTRLRAL